jgi:hypothetical protein
MKPIHHSASPQNRAHPRGFALIASLTMMVLLVALGVGLLSLSSLSLSTSRQGSELADARANARLALAMALAQLQAETGPDQRVTTTADQLSAGSGGSQTDAAPGSRHWTGVYQSWTSDQIDRPAPQFRAWLVSGDERVVGNVDSARNPTGGSAAEVELVAAGTVGDDQQQWVRVPAIEMQSTRGGKARLAWWTGDQGVKAALTSPPREENLSLAAVRTGLQGAPRQAVELVSNGTGNPFEALDPNDSRLQLVADWQHSAFLASDPVAPRPLFHDLAPFSNGLLTNVRAGGFRRDLSMELERPATRSNPSNALYSLGGRGQTEATGINFQELSTYYNVYKVLRTGSVPYTTGGRISPQTAALRVEATADACRNDENFFYKQPVIISYQMVLSFESRPVTVNGASMNRVHLVADPILTFWNPLDVPVVIPTTAFMSVKYMQLPYDFDISVNGGPVRKFPIIQSLSGGDSNYLSLRAGEMQQLVFKPGEVIKVSQTGNTIVGSGTDHNLQGRSGFNFGGGRAVPLRDASGTFLDLRPSDSFTYEARPNTFTMGRTSSSGSVPPGYSSHTRHFSLTHHEYYVGTDRGGNSLGIGNMTIDWDFGDRRLRVGESREVNQAGTKPSSARFNATRRDLSDVFRTITRAEGRPLRASDINSSKAPVMLLSFNAKTEMGSDLGTRSLSRFNPKALHVDFYDMSRAERDMLPYEYVVTPLTSWRNRHLEVSSNGSGFFGGGLNAEFGTPQVITHSIPREPLWSLAAFQHSFANGFLTQRPQYGYASLVAREPLLPQISHAIGNSMAPSVLPPNRTEGTLPGGRPLADHSYLANRALWDDWFLSGIAPQTAPSFSPRRSQVVVANDFFSGKGSLPVERYRLADIGPEQLKALPGQLFAGTLPSARAADLVASLIRVDGMFNINSTSVEAWKALLGATRRQPVAVADPLGVESVSPASTSATPVVGLLTPRDVVSPGGSNVDVLDPAQWTGRRELSDEEIDRLAEAIVRQVRLRGPFLSLADFINRRVGNDHDLARCGAVQAALDDPSVPINEAYGSGNRAVHTSTAARFAFPKAEEGALSSGIPGVVKQADILTPIAPVLSARSDSFIIRAYGETTDANGKVLARAWCEAVVERQRDYFDTSELPETRAAALNSNVNKLFGRRYEVLSFRWLHPEEI